MELRFVRFSSLLPRGYNALLVQPYVLYRYVLKLFVENDVGPCPCMSCLQLYITLSAYRCTSTDTQQSQSRVTTDRAWVARRAERAANK